MSDFFKFAIYRHILSKHKKTRPALRTKIKILCRLISAVSAFLVSGSRSSSAAYLCQMMRKYLYRLASGYHLPNLRIKLINSSTAAGLYIVMLIPLKYWYKEKRQNRIRHEHVKSSILPADSTGNQLIEVKVLSAICNSHDKKHVVYPGSNDTCVRLFARNYILKAVLLAT